MKPHGLKGEVTISLDADIPNDMASVKTVFAKQGEQLVPYFITAFSLKGNKAFVKLEDVNTIEQAEKISKCLLFLPKSERPKSKKGEFYSDEITGFIVEDENQGKLGEVVEIIQTGPQRFLSINYGEKEILIPVNGPFITSINKTKNKITVNLPEGFLDM